MAQPTPNQRRATGRVWRVACSSKAQKPKGPSFQTSKKSPSSTSANVGKLNLEAVKEEERDNGWICDWTAGGI
jgi:hypothetical protein